MWAIASCAGVLQVYASDSVPRGPPAPPGPRQGRPRFCADFAFVITETHVGHFFSRSPFLRPDAGGASSFTF